MIQNLEAFKGKVPTKRFFLTGIDYFYALSYTVLEVDTSDDEDSPKRDISASGSSNTNVRFLSENTYNDVKGREYGSGMSTVEDRNTTNYQFGTNFGNLKAVKNTLDGANNTNPSLIEALNSETTLNGAMIGTKPNEKMTFQGSLPHIRFLRDFAKVLKQFQIACIFP